MTARAAVPAVAGVTLPAVASTGIREVLMGRPHRARLLGTAGRAIWLAVGDEVVVVATADGVRLPNTVALAVESSEQPLDGVADGGLVGGGSLDLGGFSVEVVRWWDPRPVLPPTAPEAMSGAVERLDRSGLPEDGGLGSALDEDPATLVAAASGLIGRGSGLTPEGDDIVAGAVAGHLLAGEAIDSRAAVATVREAAEPILAMARHRTTALSASLLRHAFEGAVAGPAGSAHGSGLSRDTGSALRRVTNLGHSSGPALAAGLLTGVASACRKGAP